MRLPEEIVQIIPYDGLIRVEPFYVQIWFKYPVRNVSIDTVIDEAKVAQESISIDEYDEEKHWKYNLSSGDDWWSTQRNYFWIVNFAHMLTSGTSVEFVVTYEYQKDVWTEGTHSFFMSHSGHTHAEPNQYGKFSWEL